MEDFRNVSKITSTNITRLLPQNCGFLSLQCAALKLKKALFWNKILHNILALFIFSPFLMVVKFY